MRSPDPTLPSITFVLSQAQPAVHRSKSSRRWNRFAGVRRSKSSPSFAPHPPRYPPRLDSEFLTTVDYRFSSPPPPRTPSRSSFALPKDIFDDDAEIEIVMPSPTESESSTESTAGCSSSSTAHSCTYNAHAHAKSRTHTESLSCCGPRTRRRRARAVTAFINDALSAFRSRWPGIQTVRRAEERIPFDLCN